MLPDTWKQLSPLLDALLDLEPGQRHGELDALCAQHPEHADTLRKMVALEEAHPHFLNEPLVAPQAEPQPGMEVGPYRLERLLGQGGMGQVWLAARADGLYERQVALKLLRPGLVSRELRQHFHLERQILARLMHPNIAPLLDAGISSDGQP